MVVLFSKYSLYWNLAKKGLTEKKPSNPFLGFIKGVCF
jgi:hypothetical protein